MEKKCKFLTYGQFLPMWMKKNDFVVLFVQGEKNAKRAYRIYRKTRRIPLEKNNY